MPIKPPGAKLKKLPHPKQDGLEKIRQLVFESTGDLKVKWENVLKALEARDARKSQGEVKVPKA